MKYLFYSLIFLVLFSACNNNTPECKYGTPQATIPQGIQGIKDYSFKVDGQNSSEKFAVSHMPIRVEFLQSGCKKLVQEYRFYWDGEQLPASFPATDAARFVAGLFNSIGQIDMQLQNWTQFAEAIAMVANDFEYDSPVQLPGSPINISINKMDNAGSSMFTVTFSPNL